MYAMRTLLSAVESAVEFCARAAACIAGYAGVDVLPDMLSMIAAT